VYKSFDSLEDFERELAVLREAAAGAGHVVPARPGGGRPAKLAESRTK
jgi:hypothetical protein